MKYLAYGLAARPLFTIFVPAHSRIQHLNRQVALARLRRMMTRNSCETWSVDCESKNVARMRQAMTAARMTREHDPEPGQGD